MGLIRNFFQVARYLVTSTADDRIERQLSTIRFGKSDYERDERARQMAKWDRVAFWCLLVCAAVGLYTMLDAYCDLSVHIAKLVQQYLVGGA